MRSREIFALVEPTFRICLRLENRYRLAGDAFPFFDELDHRINEYFCLFLPPFAVPFRGSPVVTLPYRTPRSWTYAALAAPIF